MNFQKLSQTNQENIKALLSLIDSDWPRLEDVFYLLDYVWDEMNCDNNNLSLEQASKYYQHPVWLLTGLFIETHDLSLQHRYAMANWVIHHQLKHILDFGGGFGTLARIISDQDPEAMIDIYEPYPSEDSLVFCENYSNIKFIKELKSGYDCLTCIDVLEHVADPLEFFSKMILAVKLKGYLIIANHFYPTIKCHLPCTFYLRYSFDQFAYFMGLKRIGLCIGSHATIYQKIKDEPLSWSTIREKEKWSQRLFPIKEAMPFNVLAWENRLKNLRENPRKTVQKFLKKIF